jgi:acyl-CoA thioesterase FadM
VMHMNNATIVEKLDNAAWEAYATEEITIATARMDPLYYDIEYTGSPLLGDRLEIQTWFSPSPAPGHEFSRFQQMTREGKVVARAHSRWLWKAEKGSVLANLYKKEQELCAVS